ncbi:unnamed protein product, partial [Cylicostephanus goldi]
HYNSLNYLLREVLHRSLQGIHHTSRVIQDYYNATSGDENVIRLYHFKMKGGSQEDMRIVRDYGDRLTQKYREVMAKIAL